MQRVVVPAVIGRARKVPRRSIVRENHSVLLQRPQDYLHIRREPRYIDGRLQPETLPHGRIVHAGQTGSFVPAGPDVGVARLRHGEADGMQNLARRHFVVAHQARKNRQTGGIGRGPSSRTKRIRFQIEDRARSGMPASIRLRMGVVEFVENAVALVDHQHVTIAGVTGPGPALYGRVGRYRISAVIAFVVVVESDVDLRLAAGNGDEGNADRCALIEARTEIRVRGLRGADGGDVLA